MKPYTGLFTAALSATATAWRSSGSDVFWLRSLPQSRRAAAAVMEPRGECQPRSLHSVRSHLCEVTSLRNGEQMNRCQQPRLEGTGRILVAAKPTSRGLHTGGLAVTLHPAWLGVPAEAEAEAE